MYRSIFRKANFHVFLFVILVQKINNFVAASDLQNLYIQNAIVNQLSERFISKTTFWLSQKLSGKGIRGTEKDEAQVAS